MPAELATASLRPRRPDHSGATAWYPPPADLPRWRARLERRWRDRLERVTELSVAYHNAEEARGAARRGSPSLAQAPRTRLLLRRTVAQRQALAETEAALARLASGRYGACELCGGPIGAPTLSRLPEARYCSSCQR